jgi:hypothetical protein
MDKKKLYKNNGLTEYCNNIPCDTCENSETCNYKNCKELYDFAVKTNNIAKK